MDDQPAPRTAAQANAAIVTTCPACQAELRDSVAQCGYCGAYHNPSYQL